MELFEAIKTRRSVRRYSERPVGDRVLTELFEAVRNAPSWANMQCVRFIEVRDPEVKSMLSDATYVESYFSPLGYRANPAAKGIREAPVVLVVCADPGKSGSIGGQQYYMLDAGLACQTLMLAARGLGLGSVFVGVFDEGRLRSALSVPTHVRIVGLIPLGYPLEQKKEGPKRKTVDEILYRGGWEGGA